MRSHQWSYFVALEAEYIALAAETQEAIWQKMVLQEPGAEVSSPIVIREDNKACQMFADHAGNFSRTKHIDVRYHFVCERLARGDIRIDYVSTEEQVADIFTKALSRELFKKFRARLVVSRSSLQFSIPSCIWIRRGVSRRIIHIYKMKREVLAVWVPQYWNHVWL